MAAQFDAPREPPQPSAPFYFVLNRAFGLDVEKLAVINRLMRIVPHHGLALLSLFVEKGLIAEERRKGFRREQTRRHLAGDTSVRVFELVCETGSNERRRLFFNAIGMFLRFEDDTLWAHARAAVSRVHLNSAPRQTAADTRSSATPA